MAAEGVPVSSQNRATQLTRFVYRNGHPMFSTFPSLRVQKTFRPARPPRILGAMADGTLWEAHHATPQQVEVDNPG